MTWVERREAEARTYEAMRAERAGLPCVAVFASTHRIDEMVGVRAVMRRRDGAEEWLDTDNVWRAEERNLEGEVWLPVSEEELDRLQWTAARPSWFVLHDRLDHPYAVVRKIPSAEEAFTRDLRWEPSDLLGRTDLRIEEVAYEFEAGEARAAIEIAVRSQRQRGWPRYFALWKKTEFEPHHLHSVLRRTRLGREEIHTGRSGWVPSRVLRRMEKEDYSNDRALPVSEEEVETIIAGKSARRCFRVLSVEGPNLPFAVVRVNGEHEEAFTRDLVWGPSTLLAEVADHRGRWVEELPPDATGDGAAYDLAFAQRQLWQRHRWQGSSYFAIFSDVVNALDLANAFALVKGDSWEEYAYRDGAWKRCSLLRDISRGSWSHEELPISPDEAERLKEILDSR
ncbi:hypothetical protein [Lentzea californiensis]|uniref:hypothetical protein n=1 Tax=Lentzea californiensis TaxID=438851 RepID=UPI0021664B61|nr:hypothetical protein [Lentzea californiensis]MCR3751146.1 hypothetical protein [Lentzea californiensis]